MAAVPWRLYLGRQGSASESRSQSRLLQILEVLVSINSTITLVFKQLKSRFLTPK